MTTSTSLVTGVDFVLVPTKDFEASSRFFTEVLGLPASKRYEGIPGGEFETGNLTLQVVQMEAIGRPFEASKGAIALHVDDVESARAKLESHGVNFVADTIDSGVCHMAFFEDPDGNSFLLHHRYAPPGARPNPDAVS
jgi:catechol 2,3-dioxygenase-like lactoylglutathione lyase family enzyme